MKKIHAYTLTRPPKKAISTGAIICLQKQARCLCLVSGTCQRKAQRTLRILEDILLDLDDLAEKTDNQLTKAMIKHMCSTMSDQASTEKKFNKLLEEFRSEILPLVVENYKNLPVAAQTALGRMYNFFCSLCRCCHINIGRT